MKSIIRYMIILGVILICNSSLANVNSGTERPFKQPLVDIPYVNIISYQPLNREANFTQSFVKWVNIIKAYRRVDKTKRAPIKR